jgi:hypothetical protein
MKILSRSRGTSVNSAQLAARWLIRKVGKCNKVMVGKKIQGADI